MNANGKTLGTCLRSLLFGALLLCAAAQAAFANVILTSNRAAIGPGFTIDWSGSGPEFTSLGSPFTQGTGAQAVTVSGASGFTIFSGSTYNADFLAGDSILALYDLSSGPLGGIFSIAFASAVSSVGAQLQANAYAGFTGMISAFDASNVLLGGFNVSGSNSGAGDGSAVFAGIISDSLNISRIEFSGFGDGAGMNQMSVGVPEPSTFLLLVGPLVFLAVARRRRGRA